MALADGEMPDGIREIRDFVARTWNDGDTEWIFVNTHEHEELSPGAYSIALEGAYEWPMQYQDLQYQGKAPSPAGWDIQIMTGWCLAVYPKQPDDLDDFIWDRPLHME